MVEKTHTAGATGTWPQFYEPFRNFGQKVADWLAPASEASSTDGSYKISLELPGVEEKDIDISVHDGVVTVKGEKVRNVKRRAKPGSFPNANTGRSAAPSACPKTPMATRSRRI